MPSPITALMQTLIASFQDRVLIALYKGIKVSVLLFLCGRACAVVRARSCVCGRACAVVRVRGEAYTVR